MPSLLDAPAELQWNAHLPLSGRCGLTAGLAGLLADAGALAGPRVLDLINTWAPKFTKPGADWRWLYIARDRNAGVVKIGISADPVKRTTQFKGYAFDLVAVIPYCTTEHESWLCELFAGSLMHGREWFADDIETRALCWLLASCRNDFEVRRERWCCVAALHGLRALCNVAGKAA